MIFMKDSITSFFTLFLLNKQYFLDIEKSPAAKPNVKAVRQKRSAA